MISIKQTNICDDIYVEPIIALFELSAQQRGTGIRKRCPQKIKEKIQKGEAIIALNNNELVGFCYLQFWENGKYISKSGLVVLPEYRNQGIAYQMKKVLLSLAVELNNTATIFSITTNAVVMKMNHELGFRPVSFSEITKESSFWDQCQYCPNYDILQRNNRKMCLCTAMLLETKRTKNYSV